MGDQKSRGSDLLKSLGFAEESIQRVRLGRGVVGRTTYAVVVALGVLGVVASRVDLEALLWVAGLVVGLFVLYFAGVLFFAQRNPGTALLEGAELLRWRQSELAAKGLGRIAPAPALQEPAEPAGGQEPPSVVPEERD